MEMTLGKRVKQVQADWGEFRNTKLKTELDQRNDTVSRHSETNAIIERVNWTILEMSRIVLIGAGLPRGLWDKALEWSAYTKNRMPHKSRSSTPTEIFLGIKNGKI